MNLNELKANHSLLKIFVDIAEIPSPSHKEDEVADKIIEILSQHNIEANRDTFGNVKTVLQASEGYENVPPILMTAHMDVIGDSSPVNVRLSADNIYIETDKTRTLGSDDKAGVAALMDMAIELKSNPELKHGKLEIIFTKDEELGMTGIKNIDFDSLESEYALIIDGDTLGQHFTEGSGFMYVFASVTRGKGGHSGINIHDKTRVNAIKVLSELDTMIPQGVYKQHPTKGVITSINAGVTIGGTADVYLSEVLKEVKFLTQKGKDIPEKYKTENILTSMIKETGLNSINPNAFQAYSIRSSDPENEQELISLIKEHAKKVNEKYDDLINVSIETKRHLHAFINTSDNILSEAIISASKRNNLPSTPASIHAGTEAHVLSLYKNGREQQFKPIILGVANLVDIHSKYEKIDWQSFLAGRVWLKDIVTGFATQNN